MGAYEADQNNYYKSCSDIGDVCTKLANSVLMWRQSINWWHQYSTKFFKRQHERLIYKGNYQLRHLKSLSTTLKCDNSENSSDVLMRGSKNTAFFSWLWFFQLGLPSNVFNEAIIKVYKMMYFFSFTRIFFHWIFF